MLMVGLSLTVHAKVELDYEAPAIAPESSSTVTENPGWDNEDFAVAAAYPLATDAGYQVIRPAVPPSMPPSPCRWC